MSCRKGIGVIDNDCKNSWQLQIQLQTDLSKYHKVITKQAQIDFSALKEEEQKEIGYFDIEKICVKDLEGLYGTIPDIEHINETYVSGFKTGFSVAQELLSDRRFTLEEVHRFLDLHTDSAPIEYLKRESFKYLSQPQSWEIEGEWVGEKFKIKRICQTK